MLVRAEDEILGTHRSSCLWLTPAHRCRSQARQASGTPQSAQHRVLMAQHQPLSRSRPVAAEQRDDQAEYPADQRVDDLEQRPPGQPPSCPACRRQCG